MLATRRADGTYVLGDAHGDLVDMDGEAGWAVAEPRSDADFEREKNRERRRRQRMSAYMEKKLREGGTRC